MKQGTNQRRSRPRNNNNNNGGARRGSRNNSFESNGPEVKVRGSAQQILDKYLQLARDSQSGGDRVKAESYLQFAEHYFRVVNADQDVATDQKTSQSNGQNAQRSKDQSKDQNEEQASDQGGRGGRRGGRRPRHNSNVASGPAVSNEENDAVVPAGPQKNEATLAAEAAAANEVAAKKRAKKSPPKKAEAEATPTNSDTVAIAE